MISERFYRIRIGPKVPEIYLILKIITIYEKTGFRNIYICASCERSKSIGICVSCGHLEMN